MTLTERAEEETHAQETQRRQRRQRTGAHEQVLKMPEEKSIQVCHCGWSSVTTYHGLRTHQGKKGCTPRVTPPRIPDHTQQIIFNTYMPKFTYPPPVPAFHHLRPDDATIRQLLEMSGQEVEAFRGELSLPSISDPFTGSTFDRLFETETLQTPRLQPVIFGPQSKAATEDVKKENKSQFGAPPPPPAFSFTPSSSLNPFDSNQKQPESQNFTAPSGLSSMDFGTESVQMSSFPAPNTWQNQPMFGPQSKAATDAVKKSAFGASPASTFSFTPSSSLNIFDPNQTQFGFFSPQTPDTTQTDGTSSGLMESLQISSVSQQLNTSAPSTTTTEDSADKENKPPGFIKASTFSFSSNSPFGENKPQPPETHNIFTAASGLSSLHQNVSPQQQQKFQQTPPLSPSAGAQEAIFQTPSSSQTGPKTSEAVQKTDFETPKQNSQSSAEEANRTRRALHFSTGAAQVQTSLTVPTTIAEPFLLPLQKEEELQQLQRDQMKAELRQEIRGREQKLCEIRARVKTCKGSLDEEWLEINTVFSHVIHIVEEARQRALQPLENRREQLKRESQSLIKKIQEEIEKLENAIEEVDTAADLDTMTRPRLRIKDLKQRNVNTAFAFGTLRTTVSTMMEQIKEEVDQLSALELERAPAFAVDVMLDPSTAHLWLILSEDGKSVQDGGQCQQQLPARTGRFDSYGSVVGARSFGSGRAYWEVQVGDKSGWDLGVTSAKANRQGKLKLSPNSGYWAIVHYEGDKYAALTAPPVCVRLKHKPQKVGVFVDYDEGLVSFYNVTHRTHIYSFTKCSFGDGVLPYFSPHLKQNGKNAEPLVITKVNNSEL